MESLPQIRDSGEALVDVGSSAPLRVAGTVLLRHGLVDRLVTAQSLLPRALRLFLVDGHRPRSPHATGGAVDLTLSDEDSPVPALPSCRTGPAPLPPAWRLLTSALSSAGLANHPSRWWHWSYGDRFWARRTKARYARYGSVPERD